MSRSHLSVWYRHAWWGPGLCTVAALFLVLAAMRPAEQSVLLATAILSALPWSLALLVLDVGSGFADRAATIVSLGLCVNVALVWWCTALLRARLRRGPRGPNDRALESRSG